MSDRDPAERLSRRRFLGAAGLAGAGAAAMAPRMAMAGTAVPDPNIVNIPEWTLSLGDGVDAHPYGVPSEHEKSVIRRTVPWLTATTESSVAFTPLYALDGIITPNGLCFTRDHSGAAQIDPARHRLMIHGMVDKPLVFTMEDIKRMPGRVNRIYFLECAANGAMEWHGAQMNGCQFSHGMIHNVVYTGIPLKTFLDQVGVKPKAKWLLAEGADDACMSRSIPMEKALDDCLVAFAMNGEALRPEQGYPLRLVVPGWQGNMWIKWLRRIEVGDEPWQQREETSKYTDLVKNGIARRFTWAMDAKSVITSPSPQAPYKVQGWNVISGIAWTGRGKVKRVDVSFDGGRNWVTARLEDPVLPLSMTRFYLDFEWKGQEMLLQSRAMDETGYVQPTKAELRKIRGSSSVYHNNGIQTWLVHKGGEVENVEVG